MVEQRMQPGAHHRQFAQFAPPLANQTGPTLRQRRLAAAAIAAVVIALALDGLRAANSVSAAPFLPVGFGRIAEYLRTHGYGGSGIIVALDHLHFALMLAWFSLLLAFGRSRPPQPLVNERLVFHRHEGVRAVVPEAALALVALLVAAWLAAAVHPLLAALIEIPAATFLGRAGWRSLLPESRHMLSVFVDGRHGWGNRIVVGGPRGRTFIRHEQLHDVALHEPPLVRLLQFRDLAIHYSKSDQTSQTIMLRAIGPEQDVMALAAFLNAGFRRALSPRALNSVQGLRGLMNDFY